jgi:hypothetical protein
MPKGDPMSFNAVLTDMKAKLALIPNIKTVGVGLESNLSPADYPCVRLVPQQFSKGDQNYSYRTCNLLVYFGLPLVEGDVSLESIYDQLLTLEEEVIVATRRGDGYKSIYQKTLTSGNEVTNYRLFCVVLEVSFE